MLEFHQWAILLAFAAFVAQDTTAGPQSFISEPLVAGPLVGWYLGDVGLGLYIGIAAQLVWSGVVPAGSASFLDVNVGTVVAVAVAILAGKTLLAMTAAMLWMIPVGLVGSALTVANRRVNGRLVASVQPGSDRGRMIGIRHLTGWLLAGARGALVVGLGLAVGMVVVPTASVSLGEHVNSVVAWAGILGAGAGAAIGATIRYGRGLPTLLGAMAVIALWLVGMKPAW